MNSLFRCRPIFSGVSLFFVTVCLIDFNWDAHSHPLENWRWRIPETPARNLNSVTFGQDRFVAVGNGGTILTSVDGLSWQSIESDSFEHLRGVSYLHDQFVAVGELGAVFVSTNGFDWSRRETGYFFDLNAITHGNGLYVAVGDGGVIMTSTDLSFWDARVLGAEPLRGVAYGNGQFVVAGGSMDFASDVAGVILSSPDGFSWSSRNARGIRSLYGINFLNGIFLACGGDDWFAGYGAQFTPTLLSSADGIEWTLRNWTSTGYYDSLIVDNAFGNGNYLAAGASPDGGPLSVSADLVGWNPALQIIGLSWLDVAFGNGRFVAVGMGGFIAVIIDPDRARIAERSSFGFSANHFIDVEFGGGKFMALAWPTYPLQLASTVFVSTNGVVWKESEVISKVPHLPQDAGKVVFTNLTLRDLCTGSGQFIAVGGGSTYETFQGSLVSNSMFSCIFDSPDGENWTIRQWTEPETNGNWNHIIWNGHQFLALRGNGDAALSVTGADWFSYHLAELDFEGYFNVPMAGGNGRFVLYRHARYPDTQDVFIISTDGTNWTEKPVSPTQSVQDITFADGSFFAVGVNGLIMFSTNGLDWIEKHALAGAQLNSPAWTEGGYAALLNPTRILFSPDGQEWETFDVIPGINSGYSDYPFDEAVELYGLTGGNGTFVVWGTSRVGGRIVLQSDPVSDRPPSIASQPEDALLGTGVTHGLSVTVIGTAPLSYQWFKDGSELTGEVQQTIGITNANTSDSAGYSVLVSNDFGSATSRVAQVAVSEPWLELSLNHELRWLEDEQQGFSTNVTALSTIGISGPLGHTWRIQYLDGFDSTNEWQTYADIFLWQDALKLTVVTATNSPYRLYRGRLVE